jgi:hypothetical protein
VLIANVNKFERCGLHKFVYKIIAKSLKVSQNYAMFREEPVARGKSSFSKII